MAADGAHALLTAGLPRRPAGVTQEALTATVLWPVLLALVHGAVRDAAREGADPAGELTEVLAALQGKGVTALDATNAGERSAPAAATTTTTIEMSLAQLTPDEQAR